MFWDSFSSVHILSLHRSLMSNHVAAYNHVITLFVYWKKAACFTAAGFRQTLSTTLCAGSKRCIYLPTLFLSYINYLSVT